MPVPNPLNIYHIVHADRLASIIRDGFLWSDAVMVRRLGNGTVIGMSNIKQRRLNELTLSCHPGLRVGQCTPFYFCPRSIMLYLIHMRNEELSYKGGQEPIVHLVANLHQTVAWAEANNRRWALTLSNAGARYFEDRSDLANLHEVNWDAVQANKWSGGWRVPLGQGRQASRVSDRAVVSLAPRRTHWCPFRSHRADSGERYAGRHPSTNYRNPPRVVLLRGGRQ